MERVDLVALLDEWAARFFEELDYVREGNNATKFAAQMKEDLPQVSSNQCQLLESLYPVDSHLSYILSANDPCPKIVLSTIV